jgi:hypothetical protein
LEDPAWDRGLVRETVDILVVLDQLVGNFKMLGEQSGNETEGEGGLLSKLVMIFEWVKSLSKSRLEGDVEGSSGFASTQEGVSGIGDVGMQDMMGVMDDAWLGDMLGSWSYDFMPR